MPLTSAQIATLRERIDERANLILDEIREEHGDERAALIAGARSEVGDGAAGRALADIYLSVAVHQSQELLDLDTARQRIADGAYGICITCGADIGFGRLLAWPTARRCIACQRQLERTHAHAETPTL